MKKLLVIILATSIVSCTNSKSNKGEVTKQSTSMEQSTPCDTSFNFMNKIEFGADDYGMKKYVMAFLKMGPNRTKDSTEAAELQMAHMANIERMAEEGKLVLAGPFFGGDSLRGIYIFNVTTIEEAEALTNSDPAIQAGSLQMELKEWYGSAALMAINPIHNHISKKSITE
jgi:uncharacterized protein YciI